MRKKWMLFLICFIGLFFAAEGAFAIVRHEPDLRPVDIRLLQGNVTDGGRRLVVEAIALSSDVFILSTTGWNLPAGWDVGSWGIYNAALFPFNSVLGGRLQLVSHDIQAFQLEDVIYEEPNFAYLPLVLWSEDRPADYAPGFITGFTGPLPFLTDFFGNQVVDQNKPESLNKFNILSNDYHFLQLHSADTGLYYNVPDSVVAILHGGTGRRKRTDILPATLELDWYGYTVGETQARNIIYLLGSNPALGRVPATLNKLPQDSAAIVVYLHSADIAAAASSNAVAVPVPLNVTFNVVGGYPGAERFTGNKTTTVQIPALPDIVADPILWFEQIDEDGDVVFIFPFTSPGRDGAKNNETREQFWNNRFAGMRAGDIRLVKASVGDAAGEQLEYHRVDRIEEFSHQTFVVTRYNMTTGQDTVLGADDRLEGRGQVYRVVYRDRDGVAGVDFSRPGSNGVIVSSPAIIFADNPIIKQPDVAAGLPATSHWAMGYKPITLVGLGLDGEYNVMARPFDGTQNPLANNLYPDYTRDLFGVEADALWHTAAAITGFGFELANVIRFPGTLANVPVGNTAVVLFTLRPGAGFGGSAGLDMLVGGANTIADLQLINASGNDAMPRNYTRVNAIGDLRDGTFAVMEQVPGTPWMQRVIADETHVFQAGKVYFLAVAARDGGDFDVDQGTQGNNVGKNNQCVHFSVFATVGAPAPSKTPSIEPTVIPSINPSEMQSQPASGGSGGGCSVGSFAPAVVILLAPLFLLLKK